MLMSVTTDRMNERLSYMTLSKKNKIQLTSNNRPYERKVILHDPKQEKQDTTNI
jgi:hypothetical protein